MGGTIEGKTQFRDPTFIDAVMRRRGRGVCGLEADKVRICWLLAHAVADKYSTDREKVLGLAEWVCAAVPHLGGGLDMRGRGDTGAYYYMRHALDHIAFGWGCCEPTAETFATLAWLIGFPTRTLSIHRKRDPDGIVRGHHINEVFLEGKWCFIDADLLRWFQLPDGALGSVVELKENRDLVDQVEEERLKKTWTGALEWLNGEYPKILDEDGKVMYSRFFESSVYVQEGIWSLDHYYGKWIKWGPETHDYLYGPPQNPGLKEAMEKGRPLVGSRTTVDLAADWAIPYEPPDW